MCKFAAMKWRSLLPIIFLTALAFLAACGKKEKPLSGRYYSGLLFGKPYQIDVVGDTTDYMPKIDSIIRNFEMAFNVNNPQSVISRYNSFNRKDTVFAFHDTSRVFGMVFDLTRDLNRQTMQYYDPTTVPLLREWIVARSSKSGEPNLDSLYNFVGFDGAKMDLEEMMNDDYSYRETNMRKADPRIEADFTGIASALALDHISDMLRGGKCLQYRIRYGHSVIAWGSAVDSLSMVSLGVSTDSSDQFIRLQNRAFTYRNAQDKNALIDPTYGYPADNEIVYVAVSAPSLAETEAFADAFMIMGLEKASEYYMQNEYSKVESFIFYSEGDMLRSASTAGFDAMLLAPDSLQQAP